MPDPASLHLASAVEHFPYLTLFALLILGGVGLPFPEDATLILGGVLIATGTVEPLPAILVIYCGLLIADFILHSFGRKYGRDIITHKRFHRILSPEKFARLESRFNKRGSLIIVVGRHLFGLRAQLFIVSGVLRMSRAKFILADAFSSLITMAIMMGAGYVGGNSLRVIKADIRSIQHIIAVLAVAALAGYLIYIYLRKK